MKAWQQVNLTYKFREAHGNQVLQVCHKGQYEQSRAALVSMGHLFSGISCPEEFFFGFPWGWPGLMEMFRGLAKDKLCRISGPHGGLALAQPASWDDVGEILNRQRAKHFIAAEAFAPATPGFVPEPRRRFSLSPYWLKRDLDRMEWFCFFELEPPYRPWMRLWSKKNVSNACAEVVRHLAARGGRWAS